MALRAQLAAAQSTLELMQDELGETNRGMLALTVELEKRAEERLCDAEKIRALNEGLENRVCVRTAELAAANKELEAFSYTVSHDLRAPLRAIDGFSAMLEGCTTGLDDEGRHYLQLVRKSAVRMGQLIDDLLLLARVTRGELSRTRVDLSELAHMVVAELQVKEPSRTELFVIEEAVAADADSRLLRVVFDNLLGNACKFTARTPQARIEFGHTQKPEGEVFFIRDNGAGFDMAYATRLFHPFQRLHSEAEFPGTGIGLATVRRIIERHGGRVWAEGAPGRGATVFFTLPAGEPGAPP